MSSSLLAQAHRDQFSMSHTNATSQANFSRHQNSASALRTRSRFQNSIATTNGIPPDSPKSNRNLLAGINARPSGVTRSSTISMAGRNPRPDLVSEKRSLSLDSTQMMKATKSSLTRSDGGSPLENPPPTAITNQPFEPQPFVRPSHNQISQISTSGAEEPRLGGAEANSSKSTQAPGLIRSSISRYSPRNSQASGPEGKTSLRRDVSGRSPRRPLSTFLGMTPSVSSGPSTPSIPKSFSTDRLPTLFHTHTSPIPKSLSFDRLQNISAESPRKRDELWVIFRSLDGEFHKFQSKPSGAKSAIVRSVLIPFLREHAECPLSSSLRPEDVERRIKILHKWWNGLLEMLNGKNGESVSGSDRPTILEAATSIMVRPEWDPLPLSFAPAIGKTSRSSSKSRSTTSLGSTASEMVAESVLHNIRIMFAQNLLAQVSFVVDKMSARMVPASVVTFCGKALAYAFIYCEGVAEVLVRLWATSSETLRRVLAEYDIRRGDHLRTEAERIATKFPQCLHALTFKSLPLMMRYLRTQPQIPITVASIPWHSPWVGRWCGKETDLFFVFLKFYNSLVCNVLPDDCTIRDKLCAPGFALVQAQVLIVLDATLQDGNSQPSTEQTRGALYPTFDDILEEADASATILPLANHRVVRSMAENRLIILLRDCLSSSHSASERSRKTFAEAFQRLLKAAARRTSLFDQNACFALCDLMEEAIVILTRYHQKTAFSTEVDWSFWVSVLRLMLQSNSSMTNVRVYSLLYSLWGIIIGDENRKREICLNWLLTEEIFQSQFNHWCPMVRAYFMRFLCWRMARLDGRESELDREILKVTLFQLYRVWSYFLFLEGFSRLQNSAPPSTTPCSPAPSRRLLIVRHDVQAASSGTFLSFNSLQAEPFRGQATAYERRGALSPFLEGALEHTANNQGTKKRWPSIRSMVSFASWTGDRSSGMSGKDGKLEKTQNSSFKSPAGLKPVREMPGDKNVSYRSLSFKFSLEWSRNEKPTFEAQRPLQPPRLPPSAQMPPQLLETDQDVKSPCKPTGAAATSSKYAGRALAEWDQVINECQNFFERRQKEGVPTDLQVETPALGVESFRRLA